MRTCFSPRSFPQPTWGGGATLCEGQLSNQISPPTCHAPGQSNATGTGQRPPGPALQPYVAGGHTSPSEYSSPVGMCTTGWSRTRPRGRAMPSRNASDAGLWGDRGVPRKRVRGSWNRQGTQEATGHDSFLTGAGSCQEAQPPGGLNLEAGRCQLV